MSDSDWTWDSSLGRRTCVLHGTPTCTLCGLPDNADDHGLPIVPSRGRPNQPSAISTEQRGPSLSGVKQQILAQLNGHLVDQRSRVTQEKAFLAYDQLLDEACSVLAIQHARILDLERRLSDLEHRLPR